MAKRIQISLSEALTEAEDMAGGLCQCGLPAEEPWEPHCRLCGSYWKDVDEGLYDGEFD